jgi:atypical dual specificity phosphatase
MAIAEQHLLNPSPSASLLSPSLSLSSTDEKIARTLPSISFGDRCKQIGRSKIFQATVITGIAAILMHTVLYTSIAALAVLIGSTPVGWCIAIIALIIFIGYAVCNWQKFTFDVFAMFNVLFEKLGINSGFAQFDEITVADKEFGAPLYLGRLPNKICQHGEQLAEMGVKHVLSVNEPWEKKNRGFSEPYSKEDYAALGIDYKEITSHDHVPLSLQNLHEAAVWIHECLSKGEAVYVHCRGGAGRSAMAIVAYLIEFQGMSPEDASKAIVSCRPASTIEKESKQKVLNQFKAYVDQFRAPPENMRSGKKERYLSERAQCLEAAFKEEAVDRQQKKTPWKFTDLFRRAAPPHLKTPGEISFPIRAAAQARHRAAAGQRKLAARIARRPRVSMPLKRFWERQI